MIVRPLFNLWFMIAILIAVALSFLLLPLFKTKSSKVNRVVYFVYLPIFIILALGLYGYWGSHDKVVDLVSVQKINQSLEMLSKNPDLNPEQVGAEFDKLAKDVRQSAPALARLGTLSMELGWYQKSVDHFERAIEIDPKQDEYWAQWIYSQSLLNQGKLPQTVKQKALERLATDPKQYAIVNLLAIDDYFSGDYAKAIANWQILLHQDKQLTPERRQVLLNAIAKAKLYLDPQEQISFKVTVSLADELKAKISPQDPVFVLVRMRGERAIPLFVIKKTAQDLPFEIDLDDKHSMMGSAALAPDTEVEVVAKVSKSGDPLDKAGDLRGISTKIVVKSGVNPAKVIINQSV